MKHVPVLFLILLSGSLVLGGCEFETESQQPPVLRPAGHLVINEVFTLPATHPTTYSWVEFYNPTGDTVNLTGWSLNHRATRIYHTYRIALDTFFNPLFQTFRDSVTEIRTDAFDVPFGEGVFEIPGEEVSQVRLPRGGLFTVTNNEGRLRDFTEWGPGDDRFSRERALFQGGIDSIFITPVTGDTLIKWIARFWAGQYLFRIEPNDQLLLKNPSGAVVDVVRLGTYVHPGSDPYPANRSLGPVPEFQSIARYAGGYFTPQAHPGGNTAEDFYVTRPGLPPIPHWYSQLYKQ